MQIGIVGAPNVGKSTFFSAATLVDAEIANYPFTTVKPNQGTSYVKTKCPHLELGKECQPINSKCVKGTRLIPIQLLDVAGLVPGAHEGKGLGNQFMNDLMQAHALIHVVDASGGTDEEGKVVEKGSHDPLQDVMWLEKEIAYWIQGILTKNWAKVSKQASAGKSPVEIIATQLSGLGISEEEVKKVLIAEEFNEKPMHWTEKTILEFSERIREKSKPMLIVANKVEVEGAKENFERMKKEFPGKKIVPVCSEAELALRRAEKNSLIEYIPGAKEFRLLDESLPEKQKHALEFIQLNVMEKFESTGVQKAINQTAFGLLGLIAVYPVQDQHKWSSGKGNILPDAFLVKKGSNALDLAYKIHSDFGEHFVAAVDCRTGQKIGKEHELSDGDVVKIMLRS